MSLSVLAVDDSRTMRDMLMMALTEAGFQVTQAEDGQHGLEVLALETHNHKTAPAAPVPASCHLQ